MALGSLLLRRPWPRHLPSRAVIIVHGLRPVITLGPFRCRPVPLPPPLPLPLPLSALSIALRNLFPTDWGGQAGIQAGEDEESHVSLLDFLAMRQNVRKIILVLLRAEHV